MGTSGTGHDRCPSQIPDPSGIGDAALRQQTENKKIRFWFQEGVLKILRPPRLGPDGRLTENGFFVMAGQRSASSRQMTRPLLAELT